MGELQGEGGAAKGDEVQVKTYKEYRRRVECMAPFTASEVGDLLDYIAEIKVYHLEDRRTLYKSDKEIGDLRENLSRLTTALKLAAKRIKDLEINLIFERATFRCLQCGHVFYRFQKRQAICCDRCKRADWSSQRSVYLSSRLERTVGGLTGSLIEHLMYRGKKL